MSRHNFFTTFSESFEAQHYDHLFQKALGLSYASGVDTAIIKELNLHIEDENGELPLDQYIADSNIIIDSEEIYELAKRHWKATRAWATIYKYLDGYVYLKDHSDRTYTVIDIDDSLRLPIDENGNVIEGGAYGL